MKKNIQHFLLLSALAAGCMYGINKFIQMTSNVKNLLTQSDGKQYDWRHGTIYYTVQGQGTPILLIHDLDPASSSVEWSYMIKHLSQDHTVYTLDLLGCGRSAKPALTYTNYMYVQLITDFIHTIINDECDVIVSGDSVSFVLMAANMEHTIMNRIFLLCPSSLEKFAANPSTQTDLMKKIMELPILGTFLYNLAFSSKRIETYFVENLYFKNAIVINRMKDIYYESAHSDNSNGRYLAASILGNYTNINIIQALKKIENPIFIISSREDLDASRIADSYSAYNKTIETAYLSNCKKLPQLEEAEKLYHIILTFLNS
ncbi:MAG: alpha/beta hydrolase [Lachnospiraceae bacterium]